nr:hypothetical protein [Shahe picorna-like virus 4]
MLVVARGATTNRAALHCVSHPVAWSTPPEPKKMSTTKFTIDCGSTTPARASVEVELPVTPTARHEGLGSAQLVAFPGAAKTCDKIAVYTTGHEGDFQTSTASAEASFISIAPTPDSGRAIFSARKNIESMDEDTRLVHVVVCALRAGTKHHQLPSDLADLALARLTTSFEAQAGVEDWLRDFTTKMRNLLPFMGVTGQDVIDKIEHCGVFVWQMSNARSTVDYVCAISALLKSVFNTSVSRLLNSYLLERIVQVFDESYEAFSNKLFPLGDMDKNVAKVIDDLFVAQSAEEFFQGVRSKFDFITDMRDLPIITKMYKLLLNVLSMSLLEPLGISFDTLGYTKFEQETIKRAHGSKASFWYTLFDALSSFCLSFTQAVKIGSWAPFVHSATTYEKWAVEVLDLKAKAEFLGNPAAVGFDIFEYHQRVDDALEQGDAIARTIPPKKKKEGETVRSLLASLRYVKDCMLTRKAAQASRAAPAGVLVYGGSSVGKAHFAEILYTFYGHLFDHPVEPEYKYTRNFNDPFWSGYTTSKWCIVLDDVAALSTRFSTPDATIAEVIQILNNTSYVPNQAELSDKGRTPVLAKLVVATSNVEDMNASNNYGCPLAIQRRLPYVIEVQPKKEFARDDSPSMLAPHKLRKAEEGTYDNFWNITVKKVEHAGEGIKNQRAKLVVIGVYTDIHDFLAWFGSMCTEHNAQQASLKRAHSSMTSVSVCKTCMRPRVVCVCDSAPFPAASPPPQTPDSVPSIEVSEEDEEPSADDTPDDVPDLEALAEDEEDLRVHYALYPGIDPNFTPQSEQEGEEPRAQWSYYTYARWDYFSGYALGMYKVLGATAGFSWASVLAAGSRPYDHGFHLVFWLVQCIMYCSDVYDGFVAFYCFGFIIATYIAMFYKALGRFIYRRGRAAIEGYLRRRILGRMRSVGDAVSGTYSALLPYHKMFGIAAAMFFAIKLGTRYYQATRGKKSEEDEYQEQHLANIGARPQAKEEEQQNVWYNESDKLTQFDVACGSSSWSQATREDLIKYLTRSVLRFRFGEPGNRSTTGAFALGGWLYAVNSHAIPKGDTLMIEIVAGDASEGVTGNTHILLARSQILAIPGRDVSIICLKNLPPRRNLSSFLVRPSFFGKFAGFYLGRGADGVLGTNDVTFLEKGVFVWDGITSDVWYGESATATIKGDCGSCLVGLAPTGPVILGMHAAANGFKRVVCTPIFKEDIESALEHFGTFMLQAGTPTINAPSAPVRALVPLDKKSTLRFFREGSATVYGSLSGPRARPKSKVQRTPIADVAEQYGYSQKYAAPQLSGWQPWRNACVDMLRIPTTFRQDILVAAKGAFLNDILKGLGEEKIREVMVYDTFTAINGAAGVAYVDKLKRDTSMGFPWNTSKKSFLTALPAQHGVLDPVSISPEVLQRSEEIIAKYHSGERAMPVFKAHLKDEPTSHAKIANSKTRLFGGAPVDWAIVVRMYLLSFIRVVQLNRYLFESGPGTIAQSVEWSELFSFLTQFGEDRIVAGDYKAFDKTMPPDFILAAFDIIEGVCRAAGYTDEDIAVVRGIGADTAYPLYDLNGDLVEFFGSEPSGHNLTVIINGLVNCLYMRYVYLVLNPAAECESFKENVHLMTYGDDNVFGVSKKAGWFHHTAIQTVLAAHGVVYTMADKEAVSVPFINIKDVSFLKRSWRWDDDVGAHLCILEHDSIEKSLMVHVRSSEVSPEFQIASTVGSAVREYFFYGKEEFTRRSHILKCILFESGLQAYLSDSTFPTWEDLVDRFHSYAHPQRWHLQVPKERRTRFCEPRPKRQITRPRSSSAEIEQEVGDPDKVPASHKHVSKIHNEELAHCGMDERELAPRESASLLEGSQYTVELTPSSANLSSFVAQADEEGTVASASTTMASTEETVEFLSTDTPRTVGIAAAHPTLVPADAMSVGQLGDFLSRPVMIDTFDINLSDPVGTTRNINPWDLFFNDAQISRKLSTFPWLRCDLRVEVMVNASPFYYGSVLLSYQPLPQFTPSTVVVDAGMRHLIPLSQRPHAFIDVQDNEGASMMLPFVWPKNWLSTSIRQDFLDMGRLTFTNMTTVQSANGAVGSNVSVTTYAWAENVTISGATCGLVMQSGDEYGVGPVSSAASAVAAAAKALSSIPLIRPYATATQMGAMKIARAAANLGFSNTPVIADTMPVKPCTNPVFSSSEQGFALDKLTLDPKNELTIDPAVVGLSSEDELSIQHLVSRESILTITAWQSTSPVNTLLFQSAVTPVMFDMTSVVPKRLYLTPPAWVAQMFQYWHGDMIFRFRFVSTQYHRGRVRITFDPSGTSGTNVSNTVATSTTCFNEIVDLGKSTSVEVRVPYQQALAWSRTIVPTTESQIPWTNSATATFNHVPGFTNGQIVMRVLTELTGPLATTSVPIIVSVRAADNMRFAAPADVSLRLSQFVPQSLTEFDSNPSTQVVMGSLGNDEPGAFLVNHGESVVSLRQLLRRYSFSRLLCPTPYGARCLNFRHVFHRLPVAYGFDPAGPSSAKGQIVSASNFPFNYVSNHPITWVSMCFVGTRGSVNWTTNVSMQTSLATGLNTVVIARNGGLASYGYAVTAPPATDSNALANWTLSEMGAGNAAGLALTNQFTNAMLNVSCPMYSAFKFQTTDKFNLTAPTSQDDAQNNSFVLHARTYNNVTPAVELYAGAGTDFTVHLFLNVPTLYVHPGAIVSP